MHAPNFTATTLAKAKLTKAAMAAALMTAPAAFAQDNTSPQTQRSAEAEITQLADKLSDPALQSNVAAMLERMTGVMMRLPVGKFAAAVEDARPGSIKKEIPADATIADLAGEKAENAPEMLGKQSRIAMGMMSGFAKVFAEMLPEFQATAQEVKAGFKSGSN